MLLRAEKIKTKHLIKHETKRKALLKFSLVILIFIGYFFFISWKYGYQQGLIITILSWSFFVLCTPVADAGFLIDFPLRLILKIRMIVVESVVWLIAISLNFYFFFFHSEFYLKTKLLDFFYYILSNPVPFWIIIFLSAIGTFVSVQFGDELMDKIQNQDRIIHKKHRKKFRWIVSLSLFILTFIVYKFVLEKMGVNINSYLQ